MNAFVFWGWTSQVVPRGLADVCRGLILHDETAPAAQARFEQWLLDHTKGQDNAPTRIEKVVGSQLLDRMLTETGSESMDWKAMVEEAPEEGTTEDFFEQGYWADANHLVRAGHLPSSLEKLRESLPEDIREGLNWSGEKMFLFLVSALSHPAPPPEPDYEQEYHEDTSETPMALGVLESESRGTAFPEMSEKEATAIVQARNSVVAAWIWRKYAAETPLKEHDLAVYPLTGILLPP